MGQNLVVPIVNNSGQEVTFERQTADNSSRGTITLGIGNTHYEPGVYLTYETLVLKDSAGNFTDQTISMDELAGGTYEKIEVTRDFRLERHPRKTWMQKVLDWKPFKFHAEDDAIPK